MQAIRLTLRQLQIFTAVARRGSTTAAGQELSLSQSATSAALNELERVLDLQLFDRAGKRLMLNDNGRMLLPRALALLDNAIEIERLGHGLAGMPPPLRLGASTTIGNYVLPRILPPYLGQWHAQDIGHWHYTVMIGNTAEVCRQVADFELDIGLIEGSCHEPELIALAWLRDELQIVSSPAMVEKWRSGGSDPRRAPVGGGRNTVPTALLREQVWLLRERGSGTREAVAAALLPEFHSYQRSIELGSSEAIKRAVAEGLGVACLSQWVVADMLLNGQLARVQTTLPVIMRQCHIVLHRQKRASDGLRKFIDHVSDAALQGALVAA